MFSLELSLIYYLRCVYALNLKAVSADTAITVRALSPLSLLVASLKSSMLIVSMLLLDLKFQLIRWASISHQTATLHRNSFSSTYSDSGVWDTYLLVLFDRIFRSVLLFTLLPLTENNLVEKMSVKLFRELTRANVGATANKNLMFGGVLRSIACCLGLTFVVVTYMTLITF